MHNKVKVSPVTFLCSLLTGATAHADAYFGEGSGLIHLTFVKCSGLEYDVTECETQNLESSFSHSLDVGVKCQPGVLNGFKCMIYIFIIHFITFTLQLMKLIEREIFV